SASRSASTTYVAGTVRFMSWGDTIGVSIGYSFGGSGTTVNDRLALLGGPPGVPVELLMNVHAAGRTHGDDGGVGNYGAFRWSVDGAAAAPRRYAATCDPISDICYGSFDDAFSIPVTFTPGVPRVLETRVETYGTAGLGGGYSIADYTRGFGSLPPGSF